MKCPSGAAAAAFTPIFEASDLLMTAMSHVKSCPYVIFARVSRDEHACGSSRSMLITLPPAPMVRVTSAFESALGATPSSRAASGSASPDRAAARSALSD